MLLDSLLRPENSLGVVFSKKLALTRLNLHWLFDPSLHSDYQLGEMPLRDLVSSKSTKQERK